MEIELQLVYGLVELVDGCLRSGIPQPFSTEAHLVLRDARMHTRVRACTHVRALTQALKHSLTHARTHARALMLTQ